MPDRLPHVLFVDDDESMREQTLEEALGKYNVDVRLRNPETVIDRDLDWADLAVVDYFLTDWPERDEVESVARAPRDGLGVIASMRSALLPSLDSRSSGTKPERIVAFALWSGHLAEATFELPAVVLKHVFAQANNLEWAFDHNDVLVGSAGQQVVILAHAVRELPTSWPPRSDGLAARRQLWRLLGLPIAHDDTTAWGEQARSDVLDCHPPLNELSERSHGLVLLRWLLHRIVPYPCFLLDQQQLGARLRVDSLISSGLSRQQSPLIEALRPYEYDGLLKDFSGPRWWRSGVEKWLYDSTDGHSGNSRAVAELALSLGASTEREWLRPVVVTGADLGRSDRLVVTG